MKTKTKMMMAMGATIGGVMLYKKYNPNMVKDMKKSLKDMALKMDVD